MNLDSSVPAIQSSLWLQHLKVAAFWLQHCLVALSLSLKTEISPCYCYSLQVSGAIGGLLCLRWKRGLCTNCLNAIGFWGVPEMLQKLPRWHFVNARGQRCEQEPRTPTKGCVTAGATWVVSKALLWSPCASIVSATIFPLSKSALQTLTNKCML